MEDLALFVLGVSATVLGGAGLLGFMRNSRLSLYRFGKPDDPAHPLMQRVGGAAMLGVGVYFCYRAVAA